jgi:hypothetical protein
MLVLGCMVLGLNSAQGVGFCQLISVSFSSLVTMKTLKRTESIINDRKKK